MNCKFTGYVFIFLLIPFLGFSQKNQSDNNNKKIEYDKRVYIYKSFDDYKNDKKEYIGYFYGYRWTAKQVLTFGGKLKLFVTENEDSDDYEGVKVDNYWGFTIDNYLFRIKQNKMLCVINKKHNKYFYLEGQFILSMIKDEEESGTLYEIGESDYIFYSDDLTSKVYRIQKIRKEKSPKFDSLKKCIKKAKKKRGIQNRLDAYYECVME